MKVFKFCLFLVLIVGGLSGLMVNEVLSVREPIEEMVLIPSGEFLMGTDEGKGRADEYPRHKVYLDTFYIDRFEVTGKDFEEYLSSNPKQHQTSP